MVCEGHPHDKICGRCGHYTLSFTFFGFGRDGWYNWICRNCNGMKEPKYIHYPGPSDACVKMICTKTICGKTFAPTIWVDREISLVTCKKCKKAYQKRVSKRDKKEL